MIILEIKTSLRGHDLEAVTAFDTIKRKLALGDVIRKVTRQDLWQFGLNVWNESIAYDIGKIIINSSFKVVNPNKHNYSIFIRKENEEGVFPSGLDCFMGVVTIWYRNSGKIDSEISYLKFINQAKSIQNAYKAVVWTFEIKTYSSENAREILNNIIEVKNGGFFVNHHSQDYFVGIPILVNFINEKERK